MRTPDSLLEPFRAVAGVLEAAGSVGLAEDDSTSAWSQISQLLLGRRRQRGREALRLRGTLRCQGLRLLEASYGVGVSVSTSEALTLPASPVRDVNFAKEIGQ